MKVSCPRCKEGVMRSRSNKENGNRFYGCSGYPKCTNTMTLKQYDDAGCAEVGEAPRGFDGWAGDFPIFHD